MANNNNRYLPKKTTFPSNAHKLPKFMQKMGLNPNDLYVMDLTSYINNYERLCYTSIPLLVGEGTGRAAKLKIDVKNIVMTLQLAVLSKESGKEVPLSLLLKKARKAFIGMGSSMNQKKFSCVSFSLAEPFDLSTFMLARGEVEFKGGNSLISLYLSAEFILKTLATVYPSIRIQRDSLQVKNIVATCNFDFSPSTAQLKRAYPDNIISKDREDKFPGAHFQIKLKRPGDSVEYNAVFLIFDKPVVICVGCNNFENTKYAFQHFYHLARDFPLQNKSKQESRDKGDDDDDDVIVAESIEKIQGDDVMIKAKNEEEEKKKKKMKREEETEQSEKIESDNPLVDQIVQQLIYGYGLGGGEEEGDDMVKSDNVINVLDKKDIGAKEEATNNVNNNNKKKNEEVNENSKNKSKKNKSDKGGGSKNKSKKKNKKKDKRKKKKDKKKRKKKEKSSKKKRIRDGDDIDESGFLDKNTKKIKSKENDDTVTTYKQEN